MTKKKRKKLPNVHAKRKLNWKPQKVKKEKNEAINLMQRTFFFFCNINIYKNLNTLKRKPRIKLYFILIIEI